MASVQNSFANLLGAGEQVSASKKKKNNKSKPAGQPQQQQQAAVASVSADLASLSVSQTPAPAGNVVVEVTEAKAIFERAAREAKSVSDKAKLWKDWTRQVRPLGGHTDTPAQGHLALPTERQHPCVCTLSCTALPATVACMHPFALH